MIYSSLQVLQSTAILATVAPKTRASFTLSACRTRVGHSGKTIRKTRGALIRLHLWLLKETLKGALVAGYLMLLVCGPQTEMGQSGQFAIKFVKAHQPDGALSVASDITRKPDRSGAAEIDGEIRP